MYYILGTIYTLQQFQWNFWCRLVHQLSVQWCQGYQRTPGKWRRGHLESSYDACSQEVLLHLLSDSSATCVYEEERELFRIGWFLVLHSLLAKLIHNAWSMWEANWFFLDAVQLTRMNVFATMQVVKLTKFDYRLANQLETDLQKLRCRVNYNSLKFTDQIQDMGDQLIHRMKAKSNHFIALHLR